MFSRFSAPKTKVALAAVKSRITLLANKKAQSQKLLRKDLAELCAASKWDSARIRVEGLMREERLLLAYEVCQLFAELLIQRLGVLERASSVPPELAEAVSTLLFASSRCVDELQELKVVREQLTLKCGAPFVAAACAEATALASHVNERVVTYLSVSPPLAALKLKRLEEIVLEFNISTWDAEAARGSILGVAPDLVETQGSAAAWEERPGPHMFRVAPTAEETAVMPEPPVVVDGWVSSQAAEASPGSDTVLGRQSTPPFRRAVPPLAPLPPARPVGSDGEEEYADAESAARSAARSAEKATHAAAAAARLAQAAARGASPLAPAAEAAVAAEVSGDDAAALPSPPTATPPAPQQEAADDAGGEAGDKAGGEAPGGEAAQMDELTRRFEELKRKML